MISIKAAITVVAVILLSGAGTCIKNEAGSKPVACDPVTDIDGNMYQTVKIGNQVWTTENLRTTRFNDGTAIPLVTDNAAWNRRTSPAFCYYNNNSDAEWKNKFGALYNWYAIDTKKLAPAGWHVPSDSEWTVLERYLVVNGYNWNRSTDTSAENNIAKSIAAKTNWYTDSGAGKGTIGKNPAKNNRSGFSALPGGFRFNYGDFTFIGFSGFWWSSTGRTVATAFDRDLDFDNHDLFRQDDSKSCGFSVRLVKD